MKKISKLNGLILIGVFLVLMYMIYNLNILPFKYFLIIGGVLLLFVLLFVFKLVRNKTGFISRILFNILSKGGQTCRCHLLRAAELCCIMFV